MTRTELAVMLSRFAEARGMDTTASGDLSQWTDGASVPAYAAAPMSWALERGVLGSMVTETIHGKLPVSRRQCAQILVALTAAMENEPLAVQIAEQDVLPPIVSASRDNHSRLQAAIDAAAAKYGAIGVQVAVIEGGQVTDAYASGWATKNVEKMTPQHKMRIASISKVIIGMEAMRLMERGIIDLDNPIGVYWGVSMKNPPLSQRSGDDPQSDDPYIVHLRGGGRCFPLLRRGARQTLRRLGLPQCQARQYRRLGLQQLWVQRAGHDAGVGRQRQNERSAPPRSADAHGY